MSCRHPLAGMLAAIFPFLAGMLLGGFIGGGLICFGLKKPPFEIGHPAASMFDAFLVWLLLGLPLWSVVTLVWVLAMLILLWAIVPWPMTARPRELLLLVGALVSAGIASAGPLGRACSLADLPLAVITLVPVAVAPFLIVTRDWDAQP